MTTLSVLGNKWTLPQTDWVAGANLAQKLGISDIVGRLLVARGHEEIVAAADFLEPSLKHLPNPDTLLDMDKAVMRLMKAVKNKEKIAIFGDYDVDGACAAALCLRYFRALGLEPLLYVPDRLKEGYGPNKEAMETLKNQGAELILTVDCGIQAHEALEHAKTLGMDVILTDHHQASAELPPCVACVNPNRLDDISELTMLCGTGVIFYVFMALNRALREDGFFTDSNLKEPDLRRQMDLVALATICDIMPLTGANRPLTALGLKVLGQWQNQGLAALKTIAKVQKADTYACGFQLGPRINAAGRVDACTLGAQLLATQNPQEAEELATATHEHNITRQEIEKRDLEEALAQAEEQCTPELPTVIVLQSSLWHPGTIGIVAARVKERYHRPVFVFSVAGNVAKGSARSIPEIDIGAGIRTCGDLILNGGGHKMAGGLSINLENLPEFTDRIRDFTSVQTIDNVDIFTPELLVDTAFPLSGATVETIHHLNQLAPFGPENKEPLLLLEKVSVQFLRTVGSDEKHLKLILTDGMGSTLDAISFNTAHSPLDELLKQSKRGKKIDVVGYLRHNEWQGVVRPDFQLKDARLHKS